MKWTLTLEALEDLEISKTRPEGGLIPKWYVWTYYDWDRDAHIYYPIGLSFLVQLYRSLRIFFKFWLPHQFGKRDYETYLYKQGYRDGLYDRHEKMKRGWKPDI